MNHRTYAHSPLQQGLCQIIFDIFLPLFEPCFNPVSPLFHRFLPITPHPAGGVGRLLQLSAAGRSVIATWNGIFLPAAKSHIADA
jgi:hypothetical protein